MRSKGYDIEAMIANPKVGAMCRYGHVRTAQNVRVKVDRRRVGANNGAYVSCLVCEALWKTAHRARVKPREEYRGRREDAGGFPPGEWAKWSSNPGPCSGDDRFTATARDKARRVATPSLEVQAELEGICSTCPVIQECYAWGSRQPQMDGMAGGRLFICGKEQSLAKRPDASVIEAA